MKLSYFLGVLLAFVAGAGGMYLWNRPPPKPKVELSTLKEQLSQAAERNLPLPSLAVPQVEIVAAENQEVTCIAKVMKLAEKFGGKAIRGLARENHQVVLVTLPQRWMESFLATVQKNPMDEIAPKSVELSQETADCEVLIRVQ